MSGDVKRRPYRSARRREQALDTRARILEAAAAVFCARGYQRASIAAIAAEAGVAEETVYSHFGNKRALLGEVVQHAPRGPDARPVPQQEGPRLIAEQADPRVQLRLFAEDVSARLERAAPLVAVVTAGAAGEPELAELLRRLHEDRRKNLATFVAALRVEAPRDALDTVWALASPELYLLLTARRGWSRRRYAAWLEQSLAKLLL